MSTHSGWQTFVMLPLMPFIWLWFILGKYWYLAVVAAFLLGRYV